MSWKVRPGVVRAVVIQPLAIGVGHIVWVVHRLDVVLLGAFVIGPMGCLFKDDLFMLLRGLLLFVGGEDIFALALKRRGRIVNLVGVDSPGSSCNHYQKS